MVIISLFALVGKPLTAVMVTWSTVLTHVVPAHSNNVQSVRDIQMFSGPFCGSFQILSSKKTSTLL